MTYGHVLEYSTGVTNHPIAVGTLVKFPSAGNFLIAKQQLISAIKVTTGATGVQNRTEVSKRPCIRPLVTGGEQAEDAEDKPKGTLQYILDLDGVKHYTRNKTDLHQREKDLYFTFRAMDADKWDYSISPDWVLQVVEYQRMLLEQAENRSGNRHESFTSCGLMSRVIKLDLVHNTAKLKLLITGAVLLHGNSVPCLTLEDFAGGEKISTKAAVCPSNNTGLIAALKNFQLAMQIVFSDCYENCLKVFINNLEGVFQPMELVKADFLKFSVELTLREFFRVVRTVKSTAISAGSMKHPYQCARFLSTLFEDLSKSLSEHTTRTVEEEFFRVRLARKMCSDKIVEGGDATTRTTPPAKVAIGVEGSAPAAPAKKLMSKTCIGDIGGQLGAVKFNGRPYACSFGSECTFKHIPVEGKTKKRLLELTESMPISAQKDLQRAIQARK